MARLSLLSQNIKTRLATLANLYSNKLRRLPLVIFYPTQRCNLACGSCSDWMIGPDNQELTLPEIEALAKDLRGLGVRRVALSGGEPLLRQELPGIAQTFKNHGAALELLTNGSYLLKRTAEIQGLFSRITVSLDGPTPEINDPIRGARCFDLIIAGIKKFQELNPGVPIMIKTVIQKQNFRHFEAMAMLAQTLHVRRISFLSIDLSSPAFGRDITGRWTQAEGYLLNAGETKEWRLLLKLLWAQKRRLFDIIAEPLPKLLEIADHFEAMQGLKPFPERPCQAPMVSIVIDSRGSVLPCFFLDRVANIRQKPLSEIINNESFQNIRRNRRRNAIASCQRCVCRLKVSPLAILKGVY